MSASANAQSDSTGADDHYTPLIVTFLGVIVLGVVALIVAEYSRSRSGVRRGSPSATSRTNDARPDLHTTHQGLGATSTVVPSVVGTAVPTAITPTVAHEAAIDHAQSLEGRIKELEAKLAAAEAAGRVSV